MLSRLRPICLTGPIHQRIAWSDLPWTLRTSFRTELPVNFTEQFGSHDVRKAASLGQGLTLYEGTVEYGHDAPSGNYRPLPPGARVLAAGIGGINPGAHLLAPAPPIPPRMDRRGGDARLY